MSDNGAPQWQAIPHQSEMPIIHRAVRERVIDQRATDGYINATAMCKAAGKLFAGYFRTQPTKEFLAVLSTDMHLSITELIQSVRGGSAEQQGTWVHPHVAINLAQWLSPEFSVQVSKWVFEWVSGTASKHSKLPDHVRRYLVNRHKIPATHFSMLDQMTLRLLAPLEDQGYILPGKLMPDIALGRMFSKWLRERGYDPDGFPTYDHQFLDHRPVVLARLYPNELLTAFNLQLDAWLRDGRARKYFGGRDATAIGPLSKVLAALPAPNVTPTPRAKKSRGRPSRMAEPPPDTPEKARPTVMVKPHSYQPSKAELEADVGIHGVSPEELARSLRNVLVIENNAADTA